jgi:nucleoside-diphosphate-sugar epimerase
MPGTNAQQIHSNGIYHGLPTYSSSHSGLTAIITGANGISGNYMLRVLSQSPSRWKRIICLSRRPPLVPGGLPENAEHIAIDFLSSPEEIAQVFKDHKVDKVDYVFFFSYIQASPKPGQGLWSDAAEMARVNTLLLTNFLSALPLSNLQPKRIMLQTGAKNYGVHLGPTKLPQEESDPRVDQFEPNFYYPQEDALFKFCKQNSVGWNIGMPGPILGAVPDAAMNLAFPLAVYAAITQHMGAKLEFPGDVASWQSYTSMSSSMLNAYQEEWAVLTPAANNQRFNTWDDSAFTWEAFWPRLAGWYGVSWGGPDEGAKYIERETRFNPRGYGGKGVSKRRFTFVEWVGRNDVREAWWQIATKNDLAQKDLGEMDVDRVFGFLDGTVCRAAPLIFS